MTNVGHSASWAWCLLTTTTKPRTGRVGVLSDSRDTTE
jgi:hypothetical protein